MRRLSLLGLPVIAGALFVGTACDTDQSFLFPNPIPEAPGVQDLGELPLVELTSSRAVADQVIYGEVGPTGTAELGGVTFTFRGNNGPVCVWVDPELAFWNQSVSPSRPVEEWTQPDNVYDDGDLDLTGGLSVYYTGTPGERTGDFEVRFEDALGNVVPLDLIECFNVDQFNSNPGAYAGRGAPEFCTINNTLQDVSYTILMRAWSLPPDDDRLGYGLLLAAGTCDQVKATLGGSGGETDECVIVGESIRPGSPQGADAVAAGLPAPTWLGSDDPDAWPRSEDFERAFCTGGLRDFCRQERQRVLREGLDCSWELDAAKEGNGERCFCGDLADTPSQGSF